MKELDALFDLVKHLRTACPWDREQTFSSMRPHVLEEVQELDEALESEDFDHVREELGDALFNLLFVAHLAEEAGHFTLAEALEGSREKMVRRHPHVFGEVTAATPEEALEAFRRAKAQEKESPASGEGD